MQKMLGIDHFPDQVPGYQASGPPTPTIQINDDPGIVSVPDNPRGEPILRTSLVVLPESGVGLELVLRERALEDVDKKPFWPDTLIEDILTEEAIADQLGFTMDLAHQITTSYRKILALLILHNRETEIANFMRDKVSDNDLPLSKVSYKLVRKPLPSQTIPCFRNWRTCDLDGFYEKQYRLNPVFLSFKKDGRTVRHETYEREIVLPFLEEKEMWVGGYGKVARVKVDGRCHGFNNVLKSIVTNNCFALKRITDAEQAKKDHDFRKEVEALQRFSGFVHDHLVTLLMTWTIKDQYCLLFLWAEHDLDNYWINNERPVHDGKPDVEAIRWTMKQIVGMAGALDTMHNPRNVNLAPKKKYARHGDIKPENILWYNSPNDSRGIFVIADLGLTTLNSTKSRSMQPGRFVPVTAGYRPPECDLKGGVVSRAFDVWTYGCLLLELVCWILGGQAHRKRFETYRKTVYITNTKSEIFFDIIESSDGKTGYAVSVKKEVTKWIADLHNHEYCTQFVHELLDLIEDQMITVVSAVRERIKTDDLHQRLKDMYRQVTDDSSPYCQIPFPEPRRPKVIRAVDATLHDDALALIKEKEPKLGVHDSSQYGKTQASKTPKQLADLGN